MLALRSVQQQLAQHNAAFDTVRHIHRTRHSAYTEFGPEAQPLPAKDGRLLFLQAIGKFSCKMVRNGNAKQSEALVRKPRSLTDEESLCEFVVCPKAVK